MDLISLAYKINLIHPKKPMFKAQNQTKNHKKISDDARTFPKEVFDLLKNPIFKAIISEEDQINSGSFNSQHILNYLFELGKTDLSIGRIIEGHINALLLIQEYGNETQKKLYLKKAAQGTLFGIWNTEFEHEKVKLRKKGNSYILNGAKNFCSGALNIQFAVITASRPKGSQMIIIETEEHPDLSEDWSLWDPSGMRASVSCRIDFANTTVSENQFLGDVHDYYKDPIFSWGAVRFSAVQLGGAQSIFESVLDDLKKRNRNNDPYQKQRLGKMAILLQSGKLWLTEAEKKHLDLKKVYYQEEQVNFSNMMRSFTLKTCEEVIAIAEKAVGVQAYIKTHPLEKTIRDLRVYLKQAGPDMALANVGEFMSHKRKNNDKL